MARCPGSEAPPSVSVDSPGRFLLLAALVGLCLAACGGSAHPRSIAASGTRTTTWTAGTHVRGVVDLSAPRADGSIVVAAAGRLSVLSPQGAVRPHASSYSERRGLEPYIALSPGQRVRGAHCAFVPQSLYALRLSHGTGVTLIDRRGHVRQFARLPRRGLEDGIAFDGVGRFNHRLLVTASVAGRTTVYEIDCRGRVTILTRTAARVEGGIAVAPLAFGRFGGRLITTDELSGNLYAIGSDGRSTLVSSSGLRHGQDVGVESLGFVPSRFAAALVADRRTRRNRHPGDDVILRLRRTELAAAGVRAGDLLAVTEGGANTIAVRCAARCRVRHVADGPAIAHIEGHVVFSGG
jgi:hypothetical protein